ncbi:hypothetical protein D9Q98_010173 [Chlorella vulgaris]|uniref:HAUS augmin-like complex subunit 4 n=1 Tax=Chlorella vulgaris TaxID=3077 RepID=A0A9D4YWC5_CHLVU|nr:hypothetical protein D9Q98_010173 [Chlorella vulgaris]
MTSHLETAIGRQMLREVLDAVANRATDSAIDEIHLRTLRRTGLVTASLQQLQLCGTVGDSHASSSSGSDGEHAAGDAAATSHFAGTLGCRLGVSPADLLAEALPSELERCAALAAVRPAVEAELQRRCRLVATASGYSADDCTALPDHLGLLLTTAAASQAAQAGAWQAALGQAHEAVGLLAQAAQLLADMLRQHKLGSQKAANESQAAWLHSECAWLKEKLQLVELQLHDGTYTEATLPALRQVAEEVETTVGQAAARLKQATMKLQQYRAMGAGFLQLARQHSEAVQAVEEAEYELRELEQYRQLAAVMG